MVYSAERGCWRWEGREMWRWLRGKVERTSGESVRTGVREAMVMAARALRDVS